MAILKGFPPSNTISPSVRITEKDLSFIAPSASFHRAGLVGFASKGPINVPTSIATIRQLHTTFGYPHPENGDPYLIYAAEQYLMVANELYVVRVADEDAVSDERAKIAEVDLTVAGSEVVFEGSIAGPFDIAHDSFFRWKLNGITSSKTLVVLSGDGKTATEIVDELNEQLVAEDGIEFYVKDDDYVAVKTTFSYGASATLELLSVSNALYGPTDGTEPGTHAQLGLGTGMNQAKTTSNAGYASGYDVPGQWDFTDLENLQLQIVIDGSDDVLIDNSVQTIDFADLEGSNNTTAEVVAHINNLIMNGDIPGGFYAVGGSYNDLELDGQSIDLSDHVGYSSDSITLATLHHGRDARLLVKSESTAFEIFNFKSYNYVTDSSDSLSGTTAIGESPDNDAGDSVKAIGVGDSSSDSVSFTLTADSAGIEGNTVQVVVKNDIREGVFKLEVYANGINVESWGNLTKDTSSRFYIGTYLDQVSDYIRVSDNTDVAAPPANGTYTLSGGTDGIPSDPDKQDELLIGSDLGFTGLFALSEPEQIEIDLLAVPGHSSTSVVTGLLNVCQNYRMDCLALVDPPFGLTVKEIIHWQNGTHPLNSTRLDSDFGALYWPWVKIRDNYNRVDVWVPPSGSVMATIARSDSISEPWYAPAGASRGTVPNITDVYDRPTLEERDAMYGNRNAINPIIQFSDIEGFTVWGNKTLQRKPTALDRINVRRLMFYIEKRIRQESKFLLFEPNDETFRTNFELIVNRILDDVKLKRGLTAYIVQADGELNTPDTIDRNEFRARIGIQPTRAVEFMFIEFSLHRTGSFASNAENF
jgi:phage tail sheath protein FI